MVNGDQDKEVAPREVHGQGQEGAHECGEVCKQGTEEGEPCECCHTQAGQLCQECAEMAALRYDG